MIDRNLLEAIPDTAADAAESRQLVALWSDVFERIFILLVARLLSRKPVGIRELFDAAKLSELGYLKSNSLGTQLGQGIGGKGRMKLHRVSGAIAPVQENLRRLLDEADDDQIERLLAELEIDFEELVKRIESLPLAKPEFE